jgi:tetratricopeptide (TPR) repeat protein
MAIFRPYHYGAYKWDEYLLDIHNAIDNGNVQDVQHHVGAEEVAREQTEELRRETDQLHQIGRTLESGFEELRAEFQWGFTLMLGRMDTQIEQLAEVTAKLDAIHKTLQSPLLTQAKELFQLGQENYRKGLLDKALEAYLKAEEKQEVYFPLQLQIGKLFLYGRDEDDNVINLTEAERHLLLAARYAGAEKGSVPQWNRYCGEAYFHAAVAAYLIGEQEQTAGQVDSMRACLERAQGHLTKASSVWPQFTETVYLQAKCHALLGQTEQAVQKLGILTDRDRRYFTKATQDRDFVSLGATIETLFKQATTSPGPLALATQRKIDAVVEAIAWGKRSAPTLNDDISAVESIEREVSKGRESLLTLEVDIEGLSEWLSQTRVDLSSITRRSFQSNIRDCEKTIASLEERRSLCAKSIDVLKTTDPEVPGAKMLIWMSCIVFLIVSIVIARSVFSDSILAPVVAAVIGWIVGGMVGGLVFIEPQRHKKIKEESRAMDRLMGEIRSYRQRAEESRKKLDNFEAWQAQFRQ